MYFCFKYIDGSGYQNAMLKFGLSEKRTIWKKNFLMVLTNQLIYLVIVKTMRKNIDLKMKFAKSRIYVDKKLKIADLVVFPCT